MTPPADPIDDLCARLRDPKHDEWGFTHPKIAVEAADALQRLRAERDAAKDEWRKECDDADDLCELLGLRYDLYRTDGGSLNLPRIRTSLRERVEEARICSQRCPHYMDSLSQLATLAAIVRAADEFERFRSSEQATKYLRARAKWGKP